MTNFGLGFSSHLKLVALPVGELGKGGGKTANNLQTNGKRWKIGKERQHPGRYYTLPLSDR